MSNLNCRFCNDPLTHKFADLGASPLANSYLSVTELLKMEPHFPLCVYVCQNCLLVQLPEHESPEAIFGDYAYFSSYSDAWVQHAKDYVDMMIERFSFSRESQIVEIASNDGYLLQHFVEKDVPVLGIEPARNVAEVAKQKGIPTMVEFFGESLADDLKSKGNKADLILGNNVLAHVPDINDFVKGIKVLLNQGGVITMEFPHLLKLMEYNQYDTIYHEHYSYLSFQSVERVFNHHGLTLFDVEELWTHGGSLRIFAQHAGGGHPESDRVKAIRVNEQEFGMIDLACYLSYQEQVDENKRGLLDFLITAKRKGKKIVGYGAPAKGNTLLNYCGIRSDFLDFTVDRSPHKQDKFLPGTRIPIRDPQEVFAHRPDYILILPWNLKDEIMNQMKDVKEWGCKFVTPIPTVKIHS